MTEQTAPTMTGTEVVNSLTGFEEIAIRQRMGGDLEDLKPFATMRALAFTLVCRTGVEHATARDQVMNMPMRDVKAMFADEPDDDDRDPFAAENGPAGKEPPLSAPATTS